ncbi:MAG: M23 family metallopeptidase [Quinella sp. 1Q7]|nr:M23 family metallopeptidase [Quinella sp. 1Q7]
MKATLSLTAAQPEIRRVRIVTSRCGSTASPSARGIICEQYPVTQSSGNSIVTLYGHNETLLVGVGQSVNQGDVIAYCGSTGNSTGPHCHFEVRLNGEPVSPWDYL